MQVAIEIKYIAVSECCWILMRMGFGCLTWGHCGVSPLLLLRFTHVWLWVVFNRVFVYVRLEIAFPSICGLAQSPPRCTKCNSQRPLYQLHVIHWGTIITCCRLGLAATLWSWSTWLLYARLG